jgi:crotonobetainyl-CoA:carnitine CoA-transferase CaiB-like acyl-CoA transferase
LLAGCRVLQLGDGIAATAAGAALLRLGAEVVSVGMTGECLSDPTEIDELAAAVWDAGKSAVCVDGVAQFTELLGDGIDMVICDRIREPYPPLPACAADYIAVVELLLDEHDRTRADRPIGWVTMSAYGLDTAYADYRASDYSLSAAAGFLGHIRRSSDGESLPLQGQQALTAAGYFGALAGLHAIDVAHADSRSGHVDVSAVAAALWTGPILQLAGHLLDTGEPGGTKRLGAPSGTFHCIDGDIRIVAMEDHHWAGLLSVIDAPEWIMAIDGRLARFQHRDEINTWLADWFKSRPKMYSERILQDHGVPVMADVTTAQILQSPQLAFRDCWSTVEVGGQSVRLVAAPYTVVHHEAGTEEESLSWHGLAGLKVLEASHVLAVPVAGSLLAMMGADVLKLEELDRLDMYRRTGPFIDGQQGLERSAYFALANHPKRSFAFRAGDGVPAGLVEEAHVIVENWGRDRAGRHGLDVASVATEHPSKLAISSSGFGHQGPMSHYRVYAYNLQAGCGVTDSLSRAAGGPVDVDVAFADVVASVELALLISAWAVGGLVRGHRPAGIALDLSMAEVTLARQNLRLAADQLEGWADANEADSMLITLDDGVRFALTVRPDNLSTLAATLGVAEDSLTRVTGLARAARVSTAVAGLNADALFDMLQSAGLPCSPVYTADRLAHDITLVERGFLAEIDHPLWGKRRLPALPWKWLGQGPLAFGGPPLIGDSVGFRSSILGT